MNGEGTYKGNKKSPTQVGLLIQCVVELFHFEVCYLVHIGIIEVFASHTPDEHIV